MNAPTTAVPPTRDAEVISLIGFGHATSHFFHLMLPPLFPWLMPAFGLSFTEVGSLMTIFFVISGTGQALAGFVVDRVGAHRVLFGGIGLLALSGVLLGLANGFAALALAAAVAGLGNSVFHPADYSLLNHQVTPPRLSHAFSMHGLSGYLGWAAAPPFMAGIASLAGWRSAAFAAALLAACVLVVLYLRRAVLDDAAHRLVVHHAHGDRSGRVSTFGFLASRSVWMCFGFFLTATMAFGALQNFAPTLLERLYGLSLPIATSALSAYLVGGAGGTFAGGFLAARRGDQDRIIAAALFAAALMALLLATGTPPPWTVVGLMAVMGFGTGIAGPSRDLLVRRAATSGFGVRSFGRIYGVVYSGLDVGLAAAPLVFGRSMDAGRFQQVLIGVAILQGLAILTAIGVGVRARMVTATEGALGKVSARG